MGVGGGRMSLEAGAQTRAARRVADEIQTVIDLLGDLGTGIETAAPGFVGNGSAGLAEALGAWFDVAGRLPGLLADYATALAAVDTTAVGADAGGASGLAGAPSGSSGLNMGPGGPK